MELFQSIAEAISLYRYIFLPLVGLLALVIIFIRWWDQVRYFFLNVFSGLPVIGYVARLARSNEPRQMKNNKQWHPAEEALCAKYWQHYDAFNHSADFYRCCINYLNKVDEHGRKPTGPVLWFCSVALVLLEAFIFALVLSPFIANNISANQAEFSAIVISVLIGVVLVPATHLMGAELHKNSLLKKIQYWYQDARAEGKARALSRNKNITLEETHIDDADPQYLQMFNRVHTNVHGNPRYWATAIALSLILFFAVGAYFVRAATIDSIDARQINGSPFSQSVDTQSSPFDLPADAAADNARADSQATEEIGNNRVFASKLTFIILSVIFVGVQLIGILIGLYRSFAGIESKTAAKYAGNFSSSEEFSAWHSMKRDRVERDGQEKLSALQHRLMMKRTSSQSQQHSGLPDFRDFINAKLADRSSTPLKETAAHSPVSQQSTAEIPAPAAEHIAAEHIVEKRAVAAPVADVSTQPTPSDEKARINALGDLVGLEEEDLALIADDQGLSLEALIKRQRVQKLLNKTQAKGEI